MGGDNPDQSKAVVEMTLLTRLYQIANPVNFPIEGGSRVWSLRKGVCASSRRHRPLGGVLCKEQKRMNEIEIDRHYQARMLRILFCS